MVIIFNQDGSIRFIELGQYIQKGNHNVDLIQVGIYDSDISNYSVTAQFELPDGTTNQIITTSAGTYVIEEETIITRNFYLTSAQTIYDGILKMSIQVVDGNARVLYTYQTEFTINPSTSLANATTITQAEYNAIVVALAEKQTTYVSGNVRAYSSLGAAQSDLSNIAENQVVFVMTNSVLYPYRKEGSTLTMYRTYALDAGIGISLNGDLIDIDFTTTWQSNKAVAGDVLKAYIDEFAKSLQSSITTTNEDITISITLKDKNGNVLTTITPELESATSSKAGILTAADKVKINNIASDIATCLSTANAYTDSKVSSVYKPKGSKTVAQLNALTSAQKQTGDVYNLLDSGTLTDGSVSVVAGDNVVWVDTVWDKLSGSVDLTPYFKKDGSVIATGNFNLGGFNISNIGSIYIDSIYVKTSGNDIEINNAIDMNGYEIKNPLLATDTEIDNLF